MDRENIDSLRRALLMRAEREPDWEDLAADQTAAALLASVGESERIAAERIQIALNKMARGSYGACVTCGEPIDEDRLRAVPESDQYGGCISRH